ncbi:MAG: substrate-binding domain-containing protein [Planctomycetaceae bacterium]
MARPPYSDRRDINRMPRGGRANPLVALTVVGCLLVASLVWLLSNGGSGTAGTRGEQNEEVRLTISCAAVMRPPMESIAKEYRNEFGVGIDIRYGGSNMLLTQLKGNSFDTTDLFLAADDFFTDQAVRSGLARETLPVASNSPVLVVPKGNPKGIRNFTDLLRSDVRVSLADDQQAAIGKAVRRLLYLKQVDGTNRWEQLTTHVQQQGVLRSTVNEVADDVRLGNPIDAGLVWASMPRLPNYSEYLEVIDLKELHGEPDLASVAVLNASTHPVRALHFARYIASSDRGLLALRDAGMDVVDGDRWDERPEMTLYCDAKHRRIVEPILQRFEQREGVVVQATYADSATIKQLITMGQRVSEGTAQRDLTLPDLYLTSVELESGNNWETTALSSSADFVGLTYGLSQDCQHKYLARRLLQEILRSQDLFKNEVRSPQTRRSVVRINPSSVSAAEAMRR